MVTSNLRQDAMAEWLEVPYSGLQVTCNSATRGSNTRANGVIMIIDRD